MKSKTHLTGSTSPEDLLAWMTRNLTYHGVQKKFLYTADEVVKFKKGHCWETAELAYVELSALGYECYLLYLEDDIVSATHTTLIYKQESGWKWFEWAWEKQAGIKGGFNTVEDVTLVVMNLFKSTYGSVNCFRGYSKIKKQMTQVDYINSCYSWKKIKLKSNTVVYYKW